jgi:hypothetical protein
MKKFILFSVIFIFLAGVGWGQAEFIWTGIGSDTDWGNPLNWDLIDDHGVPSPTYPGEDSRVDDIVIIEDDISLPVQFSHYIKIKNLSINNCSVDIDTNSYNIEISDKLSVDGSLTINSNGGQITINDIVGDGDIELVAGSDDVIITGVVGESGAYCGEISITGGNIAFNKIFAAKLTVNGNGTIDAVVLTTGNQEYNGAVTLGVTGITLTSDSGNITVSGIVTGEDFTVIASQGISLNSLNELSGDITLNNTKDIPAGNINFRNDSLSINLSAVNNSAAGDIIINQTGDLVISSLETSPSRNITIEATGEVTQTGAINTNSLEIEAGTKITLNKDNIVNSVKLESKAATSAQGNITYNNDVGTTLEITVTTHGNVSITEKTGGLDVKNITSDADIDLVAGGNITFNSNITANKLTAKAGVTGFIEFKGKYIFEEMALEPGSEGIILAGADIKITKDFELNNNEIITLDSSTDSSIEASRIIINEIYARNKEDLSLMAVSGDIVFNGTVGTSGKPIGNITSEVTSPRVIKINADITADGTQIYTGQVELGGLGTGIAIKGTTITFGFIDGKGKSLTITGNGVLSGGSGINVLTVNGTAIINADITSTGDQTYTGAVTLGGDIELEGRTVTLGAINGNLHSLTITGNVDLNGGSGIDNISVSGTAIINANITSTGNQTYTGAVTLGSDVNFTSNAGSIIEFKSTVNGTASAKDLTITNANVIFNDKVGLPPTTYIKSVIIDTGTVNIKADITTTGIQNYGSGAVSLTGTRTLTSTSAAGNIIASDITGADITINSSGNFTAAEINCTDITINAGGNISLLGINGSTVILNAGFPEQTIFGTPGTVTLKDITVANLIIYCKSVDSPVGASSYGTKNVTGNVGLYTDDDVINETGFLTYFNSIGGITTNELRARNIEFGSAPTPLYSNFKFIDSTDPNSWDNPIIISGHNHVYITGTITALGDLVISTELGNIVFESNYNSNDYNIELNTEGGQVIQSSGKINVDNKITLNVKGNIIQNGGEIITKELEIITNNAATLAQNNEVGKINIVSSGGDVTFNNITDIEISGITGANLVKITVNGDIDLSGGINASSITMEAGSITGNGAAVSAGDISFINSIAGSNTVSLAGFNAAGTIFITANAKDIVYYSSVTPATPPSGGTWVTPLFVEANSVYGGNVELKTKDASSNIYLVDVIDTSGKKLTVDCGAGTGTNGFIEFFTTKISKKSYEYSGSNDNHLELLPGAGGVKIIGAIIDFTKNIKLNNAELTLEGSTGSVIKALNITLDKISAASNQDLTLEASENIIINETIGTNISPLGNILITGGNIFINDNINSNDNVKLEAIGNISVIGAVNSSNIVTLEAGKNITGGGKISAYQLIAKAKGTVTVYEIEINLSNTGNEGLNAAIYIEADDFIVTGASSPPSPYFPIIPGGTGGQLCLNLNKIWTDSNYIDGPEDEPPGTIPDARWHQHRPVAVLSGKILYSFTEDLSGDGRLDRIRVQTNVELYGDFHDFDVSVEEYEVDRTKGVNGFVKASEITLKTPFDDDSFYIYLKEKPEIESGKTPLWSITKNTSLTNKTGSIVGNPAVDINIKPIDTIPPRIVYTLTLPEHPQTYMQVSEPVVSSSGADISASFGGLSVQGINHVEPAGLGYLFNLSGSLKTDDLAKKIDSSTLDYGYFQTDAVDHGQKAEDLSAIDPESKPPKYPLNWDYSKYVSVSYKGDVENETGPITMPLTDILIPPNKLLTAGITSKPRRVTDVLVSMAPANTNSNIYFAWPVWARFKKSLNAPYTSVNDVFWGQQPTDTGIIWQFDGTNFLETNFIDSNEGLELQVRINNNLSDPPVLFWTTLNIPAEYRNPKEAADAKKTGGLWLPNVFSPLYNYVSLSDGINGKPADSSSSKLFNYDIASNSLNIESSAKFEFIFRLSNTSDMFIARLDIPREAAIPANWYTLIRPFVFDIQNIRRQRGGVTVLNNVINSNNRETAFIRYHLTRPGRVTVQIYTLDGTLVKSLRRSEQRDAGEWTDSWDGTNNGGRAVARGMYFVRVVGPDIDEIRKIMVIK